MYPKDKCTCYGMYYIQQYTTFLYAYDEIVSRIFIGIRISPLYIYVICYRFGYKSIKLFILTACQECVKYTK